LGNMSSMVLSYYNIAKKSVFFQTEQSNILFIKIKLLCSLSVKRVFYSAFVFKCTEMCKHRFRVQLLQNPPLCSITLCQPRKKYEYLFFMLQNLLAVGRDFVHDFFVHLTHYFDYILNKKAHQMHKHFEYSFPQRNRLAAYCKTYAAFCFLFKIQEGGKHMGGGQREVSPPGSGSFRSVSPQNSKKKYFCF
jgi:hypothetical protein